jgi:hypothetical protein
MHSAIKIHDKLSKRKILESVLLSCITMMNNIISKKESQDIDLTWFDNVPTSTENVVVFCS